MRPGGLVLRTPVTVELRLTTVQPSAKKERTLTPLLCDSVRVPQRRRAASDLATTAGSWRRLGGVLLEGFVGLLLVVRIALRRLL